MIKTPLQIRDLAQVEIQAPVSPTNFDLPSSGVVRGQEFKVVNNGTATLTVRSSDTSQITTVEADSSTRIVALQDDPTSLSHWFLIQTSSGAATSDIEGGVNYTTNSNFNDNIDSWFVTSGSGSLSQETVNPIEGSGSLKFTSDGSASTVDGYIDTIDDIDIGVLLGIEATIDTPSTTTDGYYTYELYNNTDSQTVSGTSTDLKPGRNYIRGSFVPESGKEYYHRIKDISGANADELVIDRVKITPDGAGSGAVINSGPLTDYDSSYTLSGWGTGHTDNLVAVRHGNWLHIVGNIETGSSSFNDAGLTFGDLTPDLNQLKAAITSFYPIPGTIQRWEDNGTFLSEWYIATYYSPQNEIRLWPNNDWNTQHTPSSGYKYQFDLWVPISDFDGTVNLLDRGVTTSNAKARATSDNGQSISTGSPVTVVYEDESYDEGNNYDPSTGQFTAPVDGKYKVTASVRIDDASTASAVSLRLYKNTTSGSIVAADIADAGAFPFPMVSDTVSLQKGDTIEAAVVHSEASSVTLRAASFENRFTVERVADHSAIAPIGFATSDEADTSERYLLPKIQTETVDSDGDFDSGTSIVCTRHGDKVTISSDTALTITSPSAAIKSSSTGLIPADYRPSNTDYWDFNYMNGGGVFTIKVNSSGTLVFEKRDWTGSLASESTTGAGFSISFNVT